ncbi:bifunctional glycosyltransferase family 2/GtrA family protein [Streptomyces sp. NPDC005840]|uniref:bifunctional glycosyltransferase family 2/GtrA family protein n=1 Tax=Streptomyces sp. NPDC005840 TaxID=3157072 RepID=UPI0033F6606D
MTEPGTVAPSRPEPPPRPAPLAARHTAPVLDVVVPVYNEATDLEAGVRRLHAHLRETFPYPFRITVADNASTDDTPLIAARLAAELPGTDWLRLAEKGRGRALRAAWSRSSAPVLAYVDVDLSTDLAALLPLVAPLISGHSDLAIGTRLAPGARVVRGPRREVISRCYNALLRSTLAVGFSDAQCGFKAIRRDVADRLLPLVRDSGWFFDTELLVIAERAGLRIHEVPVDWVDDPRSSVDLVATAVADLRGIARVGRALAAGRLDDAHGATTTGPSPSGVGIPGPGIPGPDASGAGASRVGGPVVTDSASTDSVAGVPGSTVRGSGSPGAGGPGPSFPGSGVPVPSAPAPTDSASTAPAPPLPVPVFPVPAPTAPLFPVPGPLCRLVRFGVVGGVSTAVHLLLFALLRPAAGAQTANAVALLLCAVANTTANRRFTFGVRGRDGMLRHQSRGLAVFAIGLALTAGALAALHALAPGAQHTTELAVLVGANLAATLLRLLLFQVWVFGARRGGRTGR